MAQPPELIQHGKTVGLPKIISGQIDVLPADGNIALAPGTEEAVGVFDYDGAAWADRHQDFRYLVFPDGTGGEELEGALEVYEPALGLQLDRERIRLCNAACAIGFLAFRCGTPPEGRSCGRTLAEDLSWVRQALRDLGEVEN